MIQNNTSCKKCFFAQPSDTSKPCAFDLIDQIKDKKSVTVKDGFFYIKDYTCKYGFAKSIAEEHAEQLKGIDIKQYMQLNNTVKYYLVIDHRKKSDIKQLCHHIDNLHILPQFVSILTYEQNLSDTIKDLKQYMNPQVPWKTHNFLDSNTNFGSAIKVALDTNHNLFSIPYLWFVDSTQLKDISQSSCIEKINYIVNIEQPTCNFVTSRNASGIYNMFINTQTYYYLIKQYLCPIDIAIDNIETVAVYYD